MSGCARGAAGCETVTVISRAVLAGVLVASALALAGCTSPSPAPAEPTPAGEAPKRAPRARKPKVEPELPGAKGVEAPVYANPAPEPAEK